MSVTCVDDEMVVVTLTTVGCEQTTEFHKIDLNGSGHITRCDS